MAIKIKESHKGMLKRDLGIAKGHNIPMSALMSAKNSKSPAMRKKANFALNARSWNHGGK